jgi:hypothetical protein
VVQREQTILRIAGAPYSIRGPWADPDGDAVAVELAPLDSQGKEKNRSYTVSASRNPDEGMTCADGLACDCPDFLFRHAGQPTGGCKHIRAALAAGLIDIFD